MKAFEGNLSADHFVRQQSRRNVLSRTLENPTLEPSTTIGDAHGYYCPKALLTWRTSTHSSLIHMLVVRKLVHVEIHTEERE